MTDEKIERLHALTRRVIPPAVTATAADGPIERARKLVKTWRERAAECRAKAEQQPHDRKRQLRKARHWELSAEELLSAFAFLPKVAPALTWTREPPTLDERHYWLRDHLRVRTYLAVLQESEVWVLERDDGLTPFAEPLADFGPDRWEWAGPLEAPR